MVMIIFSLLFSFSSFGSAVDSLGEIDWNMKVENVQKSFPGGHLNKDSYTVVNRFMSYSNAILIFYFNDQKEIKDISYIFPKKKSKPNVQEVKYAYMSNLECRKIQKELSRKLTYIYGKKNVNPSHVNNFSAWLTKDKNLVMLGIVQNGKNMCTPTIDFLKNRKRSGV